jgi:hypothetical protein
MYGKGKPNGTNAFRPWISDLKNCLSHVNKPALRLFALPDARSPTASDARTFSTSRCSKDGNKVISMIFFSAHKGASFGALCYAVDGQYACTKRGRDRFISVLLSMDRPRPWSEDSLCPLQRTMKSQDWSAHLVRPFRRNEGAVLTAANPPRGCI